MESIRIEGTEYDPIMIHFVKDLVETGDLEKINEEYYWTREHIIKTIRAFIRLNRWLNSPLWRTYYKLSDFSKRKIRNFISAILFAWKGISNRNPQNPHFPSPK